MSEPGKFEQRSYQRHAEHLDRYRSGGEGERHARTWLDEETVDYWRHTRMYRMLDAILSAQPGARWLTVGDGRYGKDAKYIQDHGGNVVATDISEALIREAFDAGVIAAYSRQNAESLLFSDESFDYAFCKESYHHFPRPALALYEMLRVVREGVVLIEPNDRHSGDSALRIAAGKFKAAAKRLLGIDAGKHAFEDSGNYVFTISRREIEKVALGLDYRAVAFKGFNDAYVEGVEHERLSDKGPLQRTIRRKMRFADLLCRLGVLEHGLLAAIIFKRRPERLVQDALLDAGFELEWLPENPYINRDPGEPS